MQKVNNQQKKQIQARAQKTKHSPLSKGKGSADPHAADSGSAGSEGVSETATAPIHREGPKVGRNDACPCGSGKKYKKCCLDKQ